MRYIYHSGCVGSECLNAATEGDAEIEGVSCGEVGEDESRLLAGEGFELGQVVRGVVG